MRYVLALAFVVTAVRPDEVTGTAGLMICEKLLCRHCC